MIDLSFKPHRAGLPAGDAVIEALRRCQPRGIADGVRAGLREIGPHLLGLDPLDEMHTPEGRPIMIANNGRVMKELL